MNHIEVLLFLMWHRIAYLFFVNRPYSFNTFFKLFNCASYLHSGIEERGWAIKKI